LAVYQSSRQDNNATAVRIGKIPHSTLGRTLRSATMQLFIPVSGGRVPCMHRTGFLQCNRSGTLLRMRGQGKGRTRVCAPHLRSGFIGRMSGRFCAAPGNSRDAAHRQSCTAAVI